MKTILFRTNSSSTIGTGHIMRDLVLASKYKDANIIFATQDLKGNINHKITEAGYALHVVKSNSKKELLKLLKSLHVDMLVIDSYDIGYKEEKFIKKNLRIEILSFDDTYERHYCDIVLNHNISGDKKRYKGLVPATCKVKCGAKYTLLRDEFIQEKNKVYKKDKKITNIFIAMGGADTTKLNIKILKVLKKLLHQKSISSHSLTAHVEIDIVTTRANKELKKLKKYVTNKKNITLHVESTNIAKLMAKSDLAIVTPSVILNEVIFMQVPFIAIQTTSNQVDMYNYIREQGYLAMKKFDAKELKEMIDEHR